MTATPDGGLSRPHLVCDAGLVMCPRCSHPIRRFQVHEGSSWARCEHKEHGRTCGAHVFVAATQGLAIVVPVSSAEYERMAGNGLMASAVLRELGILGAVA